jgi:hypothetical protein
MKLTCQTCTHSWEAVAKDAKDALKAAKINREGPFCGVCLHLEMAYRHAAAQKRPRFTNAVFQWLEQTKQPDQLR